MKITKTLAKKINTIIDRGLSNGLGDPNGQMCVEAAVCSALGLPHGDNPPCVGEAVRAFKIKLNDSDWPSPQARAKGMRLLAIAQLGSDTIDQGEFSKKLAEKIIRVLIPKLFREVFPDKPLCLGAADRCEVEGSKEAASSAAYSAYAADAASAYAADSASDSASAASAAAYAADSAADAASDSDAADSASAYLNLGAQLCLEVLIEMKSPGAVWLQKNKMI